MRKSTHINNFDGLRAIAVLLVVLFHGTYGVVKGGWIGVDIFFILSGYLITSLLKNEYVLTDKLLLTKFYLKRILRLMPALLLCILLNNLLWNYVPHPPEADRLLATVASLLYAGNVVSPLALSPLGVVWSLSVEEHFYFMWPPLLTLVILRLPDKKKTIALAIAILAIGALRLVMYRYFSVLKYGIFEIDAYRFTFCRLDTILIGALLALLPAGQLRHVARFCSTPFVALATWALIAVTSLTVYTDNVYYQNGGFMLTNLLCLSTVLFAINKPDNLWLSNKVVTWIGRRSYGIYLYHTPIFLVLEHFRIPGNKLNLLVIMVLRFAVTMLLAELSYRYLEQPILRKYSPKAKPQIAIS